MSSRIEEYPQQPCPLCGEAMVHRGTKTSWEGEYEVELLRFECQDGACQITGTVSYRQWIGTPEDAQRGDLG